MVYKGYVLKLEKDFAIVVTEQMEYLKVIKKEGLTIGRQIMFTEDDLYNEKKQVFRKFGIVAVLMFAICSAIFFTRFQIGNDVFAVVSIDINPSIELELNQKNQVIRTIPLNKEGKKLLTRNLKGMAAEEAVASIIHVAKEKYYITPNENYVLISAVIIQDGAQTTNEQFSEEIQQKVQEKIKKESVNLLCLSGQITKEDFNEARKNKISIGKYEIIKNIEKTEQKGTLQQIKNMKVKEMKDKKMLQQIEKDEKREIQQNKKYQKYINNQKNPSEKNKLDTKQKNITKPKKIKEDTKQQNTNKQENNQKNIKQKTNKQTKPNNMNKNKKTDDKEKKDQYKSNRNTNMDNINGEFHKEKEKRAQNEKNENKKEKRLKEKANLPNKEKNKPNS